MTNLEIRDLARAMGPDLARVRMACGFSLRKIAAALGTHACVISRYELGVHTPSGALGSRYLRVILAMRNHLDAVEQLTARLP